MTTNETHTSHKQPVPDQNKSCVFPFNYEGEDYNRCTNYDCPDCFWCGTEYNVTYETGWGLCAQDCMKYDGM